MKIDHNDIFIAKIVTRERAESIRVYFVRAFLFAIVEVVSTFRKTPHLVFLAFSSAEAIDSIWTKE